MVLVFLNLLLRDDVAIALSPAAFHFRHSHNRHATAKEMQQEQPAAA